MARSHEGPNPAEEAAPSTPRDPGAISTASVRDEIAKPDAPLLAFDPPEGSGQQLSETEQAQRLTDSQLEEARRKADEDFQTAQAEIRNRHRKTLGEQLQADRDIRMADVAAQEEALVGRRQTIGEGIVLVNPALLEAQGALERAKAAALKIDETVPGGEYIVGGRRVDAHGNALE